MKLTILALGSRGDVQPYVALGKGLHDAGYRVRVATYQAFADTVLAQGVEFYPVPGDAQAILQQGMVGGDMMTRNPFTAMRAIMNSYGALMDDYIEAFSADALADSDAILNQLPASLFGGDLAEKFGVPHIVVSVIPLARTSAFPLSLLSAGNLGIFNRLSYDGMLQLSWGFLRPYVARFRRKLGLGAPPLFARFPDAPVINGFSPRVVPPPPDWGARVHTVGWWRLDESGWTPPPALVDFLDAGTPPVFLGFGSMIARDPAALTHTLLDAVRQSGQRALLSSGWANVGGTALPETVYRLDYAPYDWLFPRCAAVVHHGGSGTTGFALRSGVPSMVVPFGADQPYWGERTRALGVGHAPIPVQQLTAERLASALRVMVKDAAMRARAAELGAALRAEDGIGAAVALVRQYAGAPKI